MDHSMTATGFCHGMDRDSPKKVYLVASKSDVDIKSYHGSSLKTPTGLF
jgi:hypothetical protein